MGTLLGMGSTYVGHATNMLAQTGCTVILCPAGAVAGVDVRGAAPASRELDLLRPGNLVQQVHAVLLTGGSAFGLAAADGVMQWLHERQIGFPTGVVNVPIVPAAALFDLGVGDTVWPDAALGYQACAAAMHEDVRWGRVGAGAGATVGKLLGPAQASAGGIGMASLALPDGVAVTAIVAVNALGHIVDPVTQQILAGPRLSNGTFADSVDVLLQQAPSTPFTPRAAENTTLGCVLTTATLDKAACSRVAAMAHGGLARTIRPVHTQYDGDTLFALSTATAGAPQGDTTIIGVAAAEVVAQAVLNAVAIAE